jgi:hypothetical protein
VKLDLPALLVFHDHCVLEPDKVGPGGLISSWRTFSEMSWSGWAMAARVLEGRYANRPPGRLQRQ